MLCRVGKWRGEKRGKHTFRWLSNCQPQQFAYQFAFGLLMAAAAAAARLRRGARAYGHFMAPAGPVTAEAISIVKDYIQCV